MAVEIRRHWPQIRPRLALIVLLALLGMTGFNVLYYVAAHDTSAINIAILQGSMPIFVLAGAFLAHGSRAGLVQQVGVLITVLAWRGGGGNARRAAVDPGGGVQPRRSRHAGSLRALRPLHGGAARPAKHARSGLLRAR
jgi:EamA-like transporter family